MHCCVHQLTKDIVAVFILITDTTSILNVTQYIFIAVFNVTEDITFMSIVTEYCTVVLRVDKHIISVITDTKATIAVFDETEYIVASSVLRKMSWKMSSHVCT